MKFRAALYLSTIAACGIASNADAASYLFTVQGQVGGQSTADRAFKSVPNVTSAIKAGDAFSVSFNLDPVGATPTSLYDSDPTINIYYWQVTNLVISAGGYTSNPTATEQNFATFQLWNNYVSGGSPTDHFGVSALRSIASATSPVSIGTGPINATFGFNAFDWTATARQSDSLTELPPLTAYANKSAYFGFLNTDTYLQSNFSLNISSASLTPVAATGAVPEPATWAMMILGMGVVGYAMRRRQKVKTVVRFA